MTIQTKYNVGDEVWFENGETPANGRIDEIIAIHRLNEVTRIEYKVVYRRFESDVVGEVTNLVESEAFASIDEFLGELNMIHNTRMQHLQIEMKRRAKPTALAPE